MRGEIMEESGGFYCTCENVAVVGIDGGDFCDEK